MSGSEKQHSAHLKYFIQGHPALPTAAACRDALSRGECREGQWKHTPLCSLQCTDVKPGLQPLQAAAFAQWGSNLVDVPRLHASRHGRH